MSIIDAILSVLAPYECLACRAEGPLLCGPCAGNLPAAPQRCYGCQAPSPRGRTCPDCRAGSPLTRAAAVSPYAGHAKELVALLKFSGARGASGIMAELMKGLAVQEGSYPELLVPVPTAAGRVRRRGYDQARLLARELSRQTGLPWRDCLARMGRTRQLGAARSQRIRQLRGAFRVRSPEVVRGRRVLLIDDVMTTGASLETAARALDAAGAGPIAAVTFCAA